MADNSDLQKIQASEKPTSDDFEYAYVETVNKAFVRIAKERLKEILGANRYTNEEIDQKISTIPKFNIEVVSSLPTTDISETTIYLVSSGDDSENLYTEYININGLWEILGTQKSTFSGSASDVTYDDTETKLGATNVQDAVGKLSATVNDLKDNGTGTGTVVSSVEPVEDDIPKIFFDEAMPQTKTDAVTKFRYISKTEDIEGYAEFKAQGNSSLSYPKKNETVKMYADESLEEKLKVNFKGWGKQNKHVYKANWIDLTRARNVVSARIWADIVKSRADYMALPELLRTSPNQGAIDGFPVKVYSQGIYQGRYTLNIPKDAWMANMDDELDTHCILCGEGYVSGCFREASVSQWTDEVHDTMPSSISTRWLEIVNFVMSSTDEEFKANLGNYFFVDSLIDYFIYGVVSCGLDAFGKNQLYFTYDGLKWIASMYDMDSTWGLWWNGTKFVGADYARTEFQDFKDGQGNLLYIRLLALFMDEIKARWNELKNSVLTIPNLINHFERFTDIASTDLVKEDYASTTGSGLFTSIPLQTTNNIQQIRQYIIDRLAYCDSYFSGLSEPVPATGITLDKTTLSFNDSTSQTLTATVEPSNTTDYVKWTTSDGMVASVENGVVTPIGNGNCVITATCGEFSATCNVSVTGISSDDTDYTYNVLDDYPLIHGKEYNKTTGVLSNVNVVSYTEKFTLSEGQYCIEGNINDRSIFVWDENDNYIGKYGVCNSFIAKENYKYAMTVYPTTADTDLSSFSLKRVQVTDKPTVSIDLSTCSFTTNRTNAVADISNYNLYTTQIDHANHLIKLTAPNGGYSTNNVPMFAVYTFGNTGITELHVLNMTAEQATSYFAENNTTLIING